MEQKTALITGASSGIGLAVARQLMMKGFCVYAASRRGGDAQADQKSGGKIIPVIMDVNIKEDIDRTIQQILDEKQRLDVLLCNAGNGIAGAIEDTGEDELRYQLETIFFGAVKTIQACLPVFRKQQYGKIIATSSVAAIVPIPFQAFYSAGKSALSIFMQALSIEVKTYGIQCCSIFPGDTKTDFTSARKYTVASQSENSVYAAKMKKSVGKMEKDELNGMSADFVARKIVRQIEKRKMNTKIVPAFQYKLICLLFNILPTKLGLWIVGKLY